MALIDLNQLVKGTKQVMKINSESLGGSIEIHKISAQKMNSMVKEAKSNARKAIAEQLDIKPIELVSHMSQNEELREEVDAEFRNLLAMDMVKEATTGTQTEINDEVIENISQEVLVELMNAILDKLNEDKEEDVAESKEDDIKN